MERRREVIEDVPKGTFGASSRGTRRRLAVFVVLLATLVAPALTVAADRAEQQLEFGADMARRGLWKEALFRFQQADRLDPENPRILNNIAVAYEALGLFDRALETYQKALRLGRQKDEVRNNYSRFVEFYQNFRPREETEELAAEEAETAASAATEGTNG